jgi:hypothetical protein
MTGELNFSFGGMLCDKTAKQIIVFPFPDLPFGVFSTLIEKANPRQLIQFYMPS